MSPHNAPASPLACSHLLLVPLASALTSPLSLHDALPISQSPIPSVGCANSQSRAALCGRDWRLRGRKSTRLNSSHTVISYAVFCLKKKNTMSQRTLNYKMNTRNQHSSTKITVDIQHALTE